MSLSKVVVSGPIEKLLSGRGFKNGLDLVLSRVLLKLGERIVEEAKQNLIRDGKSKTGSLVKRFFVRLKKTRGQQLVEVGNSDPGAYAVEFGRRPGGSFPNIRAIRDWLRAVGAPTDNGMVYVVAKKIAEEGIEPSRFFTRAIDRVIPEARREVADALIELRSILED